MTTLNGSEFSRAMSAQKVGRISALFLTTREERLRPNCIMSSQLPENIEYLRFMTQIRDEGASKG